MFSKRIAPVFMLLAVATMTVAETPASRSVSVDTDLAAAKAGRYAVDPMHTRVRFVVSHMGLSQWNGDFSNVSGTLTLDPKDLSASALDVTIPVSSFMTINSEVDRALKSKDWLDVETYPQIRFVSTKVMPTGPRTARVSGDLTLHGVTEPVTLDISFNGSGKNPFSGAYMVGFDGKTHVNRSSFGVKTLVPLIGDRVDIHLSAEFAMK